MLLEVSSFRQRVRFDLDGLVDDLRAETRRSTPNEITAWRNSLPAFADVLSHPSLEPFHIQVGAAAQMAVEYRLPASSSWVDAVLLGRSADRPVAVIVELKDWRTAGDQPGPTEGLVLHSSQERHHPSDQVRGYVEYCRRFHSIVQAEAVDVSGCVFFTFASSADAYREPPHQFLVNDYPVFTRSREDITELFPAHLAKKLLQPDAQFARRFSEGIYRQDRGFVRQVARALVDPSSSPFVLLDEQRVGFEKCMKHITRVLKPAKTSAKTKAPLDRKSVIVIEGPPGSGKSVIAAHLWAKLAADEYMDGNVVLTTTSGAQLSNWKGLFDKASVRGAGGVVVGANQFNPGFSSAWTRSERALGREPVVSDWRLYVEQLAAHGHKNRELCESYAVSIVDEAHALIDPTVPGIEGVFLAGWNRYAGPQAWHVIRNSRVSIFLMDKEQSYRDSETTTIESIEAFAKEFGVDDFEVVSLAGAQFRCGGSAEYMAWLDSLLDLGSTQVPAEKWRKDRGGRFQFELVEDPEELDAALRSRILEGKSARLLASYAREWVTKKKTRPHDEPEAKKDFNIAYDRGGEARTWTRIWNYTPDSNCTFFVQSPPGSYMAEDPLGEVGCPYVVRGFDFDYVGVLWLSDLVWRGNRWVADPEHVYDTALTNLRAAAVREKGKGAATDELVRRLQRGYRILLSRAIRGAYVWFEDAETRAFVERALQSSR